MRNPVVAAGGRGRDRDVHRRPRPPPFGGTSTWELWEGSPRPSVPHRPPPPPASLRLAKPFGPPPATAYPLASPFGDFGTCTFPTTPARYARALALGLARWYAASRTRRLPTRLAATGGCRATSAQPNGAVRHGRWGLAWRPARSSRGPRHDRPCCRRRCRAESRVAWPLPRWRAGS